MSIPCIRQHLHYEQFYVKCSALTLVQTAKMYKLIALLKNILHVRLFNLDISKIN